MELLRLKKLELQECYLDGEFDYKLDPLSITNFSLVNGDFVGGKKLEADQITFINQIMEHLVKNGVMNPERLFEQPFTDSNVDGLAGVFPNDAERILAVTEDVNKRAEAA